MSRRRAVAVRLLVMALILYTLMLGATFNGVINLTITRVTLVLLTIGVIGWWGVRWRNGWRWRPTPLDGAIVVAGLAVVIAVLFNLYLWRRMAIGLWYWGLFLAVWLMLADLVSNGLPARWLADGILVTGIPVLCFGYVQIQGWLAAWVQVTTAGIPAPFVPPRPPSIIGNPNALGGTLVVMIVLALGRIVQERRWLLRLGWGIYLILSGGLLFFTFSRGAWLGAGVGVAAWFGLTLWLRRSVWLPAWRSWWQKRRWVGKALTGGAVVIALAVAVVVALVAWEVVDQPERSASTRVRIWDAALAGFLDHPLTGTGPFTFGYTLLTHESTPPRTAHSHAHNLLLQVATEMGLPGLVALGWGIVAVVRVWWKRLHDAEGVAGVGEVVAAGAALVGLFGHQLLDIPMMMPSLALTAILVLTGATIRQPARPDVGTRRWRGAATVGLWVVLLVTAWWSLAVRSSYLDALLVANRGQWQEGAELLDGPIAQDPSMPLYPAQQGFVLGVAASQGQDEVLADAIAAWEQALALEDVYAPWWANLGALRWQAGDTGGALHDLQEAAARAPESETIWLTLGRFYEATGEAEAAVDAYVTALELYPAWAYEPVWEGTLRQRALAEFESSHDTSAPSFDRALSALLAGNGVAAQEALRDDPQAASPATPARVILALAYEQTGEPERTDLWMASARLYQRVPHDLAWLAAGEAVLATWRGEPQAADLVAAAESTLDVGERGSAFPTGQNLAWFHYLREAFPEQFLPQVITLPPAPRAASLLEMIVAP